VVNKCFGRTQTLVKLVICGLESCIHTGVLDYQDRGSPHICFVLVWLALNSSRRMCLLISLTGRAEFILPTLLFIQIGFGYLYEWHRMIHCRVFPAGHSRDDRPLTSPDV
jgi:hypothetical protein